MAPPRRPARSRNRCWWCLGPTAPRNRSGPRSNTRNTTHAYATKTELVAAVDNWIILYNTTRRHSAIGMLSPNNYEKSLRAAA
ncbi:IS3 family transposase [Saccharopolyspora sp. ASAGF58]|uniref:IS3 family transposase n=1 Tax=Saccharopolyspora sp. ASAGF58 TaxID=2719023 RepID=UPI00143FD9B1|nr:transposase [Saccharopolyspora sp. ASAGF58]